MSCICDSDSDRAVQSWSDPISFLFGSHEDGVISLHDVEEFPRDFKGYPFPHFNFIKEENSWPEWIMTYVMLIHFMLTFSLQPSSSWLFSSFLWKTRLCEIKQPTSLQLRSLFLNQGCRGGMGSLFLFLFICLFISWSVWTVMQSMVAKFFPTAPLKIASSSSAAQTSLFTLVCISIRFKISGIQLFMAAFSVLLLIQSWLCSWKQ